MAIQALTSCQVDISRWVIHLPLVDALADAGSVLYGSGTRLHGFYLCEMAGTYWMTICWPAQNHTFVKFSICFGAKIGKWSSLVVLKPFRFRIIKFSY